jgi:FAD/FMN-containing dehydrogenase
MQDSGELAQRVARGIAASSTTSPTPPGQTEAGGRRSATPALVEAINQVFALFRLNYHNQYYAAFSEAEQLRQIKKLWLDSARLPAGAGSAGRTPGHRGSEYLPTLNRMRSCCEESLPALGLPAARDAYLEACDARHRPPEDQALVPRLRVLGGRDCGWTFLATAPERQLAALQQGPTSSAAREALGGEVWPRFPNRRHKGPGPASALPPE